MSLTLQRFIKLISPEALRHSITAMTYPQSFAVDKSENNEALNEKNCYFRALYMTKGRLSFVNCDGSIVCLDPCLDSELMAIKHVRRARGTF